jgi:hypothetical protein
MTGEELNRLWADPPGLRGQLTGVQNDKIGTRLLLTGFFFLLLGGSFDSFVMRMQLAVPENSLVSPELYNELFTNHGTVVGSRRAGPISRRRWSCWSPGSERPNARTSCSKRQDEFDAGNPAG